MTTPDPSDQNNPFVSHPQQAMMIRAALSNVLKLTMLTTQFDDETTQKYLGLVSVAINFSVAGSSDDLNGLYAQWWTVGQLVDASTDGPLEVPVEKCDCGHSACEEMNQYAATFIEAASRGDMEAVVGVARAVVKAAHAEGSEPWRKLIAVQVSVLEAVAASLLAIIHEKHGDTDPTHN